LFWSFQGEFVTGSGPGRGGGARAPDANRGAAKSH